MSINHKLLDILACPQCKGNLQCSSDKQQLRCPRCHLAFPVRGNIPILLLDEAQPWNPEDK